MGFFLCYLIPIGMVGGLTFLIYATSQNGFAGIMCLLFFVGGTWWNRRVISDGLSMYSEGDYDGLKIYKFNFNLFSNLKDVTGSDGGILDLLVRIFITIIILPGCLLEEILFNIFNAIYFKAKKPIVTILIIDLIIILSGLIYYFVMANKSIY
jgi:hypothetical protein